MRSFKEIAIQYLTEWNNKNEAALKKLHQDFEHKSPDTDFKSKQEFIDACWGKHHSGTTNIVYAYEDDTSALIIHKVNLNDKAYDICEQFHFENGLIKKCKVWY